MAGAVSAYAEDLDGVADVDVSVLSGDLVGPAFDGGSFDFDGGAALPADEVVVVAVGAASPVERFAACGLE